jgi:hypothetical protein
MLKSDLLEKIRLAWIEVVVMRKDVIKYVTPEATALELVMAVGDSFLRVFEERNWLDIMDILYELPVFPLEIIPERRPGEPANERWLKVMAREQAITLIDAAIKVLESEGVCVVDYYKEVEDYFCLTCEAARQLAEERVADEYRRERQTPDNAYADCNNPAST